MGTIRFDIPYPPTKKGKSAFCRRFGLNAYYSGKHWAQRKKDADELHALTLAALKQARVRRGMVRGPVSITFAWDDGLDIDNHAAIAKAVVDALKGYLLPDDDHRWYRQVIHMAKNHNDKCVCPLFGREILYGECYEVQEVREDEMDMELAIEPFDVDKANEVCEKCKWYVVEGSA